MAPRGGTGRRCPLRMTNVETRMTNEIRMANAQIPMTHRWPALAEGLRCGEPEYRLCEVAWLRCTRDQ